MPSDRFVDTRLFKPLGMTGTFYDPPKNLRGELADPAMPGKSALFSNAKDLAVFAQMMLNRGIYNHSRYFSPSTVARYTAAHGPWSKPSGNDWTGRMFSPSAYGRVASEGSFIWIDPGKKLFIVLLTNGRRRSPADTRIDDLQRAAAASIVADVATPAPAKE
jgi:CubicO group peptidase (beta-lactamase class C family)